MPEGKRGRKNLSAPKYGHLPAEAINKMGPLTREALAEYLSEAVGFGVTLRQAVRLAAQDSRLEWAKAKDGQVSQAATDAYGNQKVLVLNEGGCALGVEVGKDHIAVGVGDANGRLLPLEEGSAQTSTDAILESDWRIADSSVADLGKAIGALTRQQLERAAVRPFQVRGMTLALPAPVSTVTGHTLVPSLLPQLDGANLKIEIGKAISSRLSVPSDFKLILTNDADVLARGEVRYGNSKLSRKGYSPDLVAVKISRGIGAGIISQGGILRSAAGGGTGEIGHVHAMVEGIEDGARLGLIDWPELEPCSCGRRGHLEALASSKAIVDRIRRSVGRVELPECIRNALPETDLLPLIVAERDKYDACDLALSEAARLVGRSLHAVIRTLNPEFVLICGKVSEAGERFLRDVVAGMGDHGTLGWRGSFQLGTGINTFERREVAIRGAISTVLRNTPLPSQMTLR